MRRFAPRAVVTIGVMLALSVIFATLAVVTANAATSDWRWATGRVVVVDQTGGYNSAGVRRAALELGRELSPVRSRGRAALTVVYRSPGLSCRAGESCITVTRSLADARPTWGAKALTAGGESCRVHLNGYYDGIGSRLIKAELARCLGLRTAPPGARSLMSKVNPAPKLTSFDLRDLKGLYR